MARKATAESIILEHWDKIKKCLVLGVEHKEIQKALGISKPSYWEVLKKHPELVNSVKVEVSNNIGGKLDQLAEGRGFCNSLMESAISITKKHELVTRKKYKKFDAETNKVMEHEEVIIKEVDPNAGMLQLMLQNYFKGWSQNKELFALRERELDLKEKIADDRSF